MPGYDMKELSKDMDIAIRELRAIRKELIAARREIRRLWRFPAVSVETEITAETSVELEEEEEP